MEVKRCLIGHPAGNPIIRRHLGRLQSYCLRVHQSFDLACNVLHLAVLLNTVHLLALGVDHLRTIQQSFENERTRVLKAWPFLQEEDFRDFGV